MWKLQQNTFLAWKFYLTLAAQWGIVAVGTQSCGLVLWQLHGLFQTWFLCWTESIFINGDIIVSQGATIATMNNPTLQAKIDSAVTVLKTIEDAIEEANLEPHESITIDVSVSPNPEPPLTMPVSQWIHIIQAMRVTIVQLGMQIHNRN
jgi:hypothetical protein